MPPSFRSIFFVIAAATLCTTTWATGCSSPDGIPCDDDEDCFQTEHCLDGHCHTDDNDRVTRNAGSSNGPNGNGDDADAGTDTEDTQFDDDASAGEIDDDAECFVDSTMGCDPPDHANGSADSGRIAGGSILGCSFDNEYEDYSETTETFSLCRQDYHRYDLDLSSCSDHHYFVLADFEPQTLCSASVLDLEVQLEARGFEDMDCESDDMLCNIDDDGSMQVQIRIPDTFQDEEGDIEFLIHDKSQGDIIFDYRAHFELTQELP